jgi:hypothetical protein
MDGGLRRGPKYRVAFVLPRPRGRHGKQEADDWATRYVVVQPERSVGGSELPTSPGNSGQPLGELASFFGGPPLGSKGVEVVVQDTLRIGDAKLATE